MARNGNHDAIAMAVETFTPAEAAEIVGDAEAGNRSISHSRVLLYNDDMKRDGGWKLTGQTIIFGKSGKLLDGHHRLRALAISESPQRFVVVRGIEDEYFAYMDIGRPRTIGDMLTIDGVASPTIAKMLATVGGYAMHYAAGFPPRSGIGRPGDQGGIRHTDILKYVAKHSSKLHSSAKLIVDNTHHRRSVLPASTLVWVHYETFKLDPPEADKFILGLMDGGNLRPGSPLHVLRNSLFQSRQTRMMPKHVDLMTALVRAWNWRRKRSDVTAKELFKHDWSEFPRFE